MENFIKKGMLGKGWGFDNYSKQPRIGGRQGNTVRWSFEPTGADASSSFFSIIAFLGDTPKGEADPSKDRAGREYLHVPFSSKDKDSSCRLPLSIRQVNPRRRSVFANTADPSTKMNRFEVP